MVAAGARFASRHDPAHHLLADPEPEATDAYGAWGTSKPYGCAYEAVIRSTVLVDADGTGAAVWPRIQPKQHAAQILRAIAEL